LDDSKAKILLSTRKTFDNSNFVYDELNDRNCEIILVDEIDNSKFDTKNPKIINSSTDLIYTIYTSGTTGKPKGVLIHHRNLVNYTEYWKKKFGITDSDNFLQHASYSFDLSVEEIFVALLKGASLVIADKKRVHNIDLLMDYIEENNVSVVSVSPLLLNEMNKKKSSESVRIYTSGGEVLKPEYISNLIKKYDVYNLYGPTEATMAATAYKCLRNEEQSIPIGKPLGNYRVYIVDKTDQLVPKGVSGELCIAGDGLSVGYNGKKKLTKEKFVDNPFEKASKMYRTGDLVKWLSDGNIEFLGRIDNQVQIRGFRIELGEVENALLKHNNIKEVVVLDYEDNNSMKYLCAYIVSENEIDTILIEKYLEKKLPNYMIPAFFILLNEIPVTSHGKVNKSALPLPDSISLYKDREYIEPENKLQQKIADIWKEVLGIEKVSVKDNFFDIGGNSINIIKIHSKLKKVENTDVAIVDLFRFPSVQLISEYIEGLNKDLFSGVDFSTEEKELYNQSEKKDGESTDVAV
ncbi:non-ribosomal peptide synthetase, partial [bacterium]|nr:non-ribosomal peptide synthetase [bacterium]